MNKLIALFTVAFAALACNANGFDITESKFVSTVEFSSEYIHHGRREGRQNLKASAEIGASALDFQGYLGMRSTLFFRGESIFLGDDVLPSERKVSANDISPYCGFTYGVPGIVTLDIGYAAHFYGGLGSLVNTSDLAVENQPNGYEIERNTHEIYAGAAFNAVLSPKVYVFYDCNRGEFDCTASALYAYNFDRVGIPNFTFEGAVKVGYDYAKKPFAIKNFYQIAPQPDGLQEPNNESGPNDAYAALYARSGDKKDYVYLNLTANLVHRCNDKTHVYLGANFACNGASLANWNNAIAARGHKKMLWFSGGVECRF
ncbi:MAG: hypothetical protein LBI69_05115 [Puniceicoccales bacterium]|nr:hypothetical protein [Puniceicoccales bacterium]